MTLAVAAVAFYAAYAPAGSAAGRGGRAFLLMSGLGLACILIGVPPLTGRLGAAIVWAALAPATAYLGCRFDRISLRVHAVLYGLAATLAVGALAGGLHALVPSAVGSPDSTSAMAPWLVGAGLVLAVMTMALDRRHLERGPRARLPFTALVGLTTIVVAGSSVGPLATMLQRIGMPAEGALASTRTVLTAAAAIVLALPGRRRVLPEAGWLVYPLLGLAMLELIVGDLAQGSARSRFLSFLVCGVALALCPWLLRPRRDRESTGSSPA